MMKKLISTRFHGLLDYAAAIALIIPWIVNFYEDTSDTWILALTGMFVMVMSLLTNYELSFIRLVPMKLHLFIDVLVAVFLITLPFVFPMYHYYLYWPVMLGVFGLIVVLLSSSRPFVVTKRDLNITLPSS
jgi:hypothetical protein